jgi:hypothetical protein
MNKVSFVPYFLGFCALAEAGCASVGWQYKYDGKEYTMTQENSDYHQRAIADVRSRFGDPAAQFDVANLKGACEMLQRYAAGAPAPGQFTPARELLDREARTTCAKAHSLETRAAKEAPHG